MAVRGLAVLALLVVLLAVFGCDVHPLADGAGGATAREGAGTYPGAAWRWAKTPEKVGWSSEKLAQAQAYAEKIGSAAVMIVDDGIVVDAWGDVKRKYDCHSMRKSLLSALYGIYVAEGKIDTSATLQELGIDDLTPLTEDEKQATVGDLLKARSGIYIPAAGEAPMMEALRPERHSHAPGTFWYYNNWDFNALGTIFDQETGENNIYEAFEARIAGPIGMQDFFPENHGYGFESYSVHPYYGFRMSTRDLARFGLLMLRQGRWLDQQIIPADWVRESTATHSEIGPDSGYGYMWWTGTNAGLFPNVEVQAPSYYASGYGGHKVIVLPYRKLVIVYRVNTDVLGQSVEDSQIGILLWLILAAAGETEIGEAPFLDLAQGVRLTAGDLHDTLAGSILSREISGVQFVITLDEDGTLEASVGGMAVDTGRWWIEGDRACAGFSTMEQDADPCFTAVLDGARIGLYDADGTLLERFEYAKP